MSGIFIGGVFHENTDLIHRKCKSPVWESDKPGFEYQCLSCKEDFDAAETEEQDPHYHPPVYLARPLNGVPANPEIEYIVDGNQQIRHFKNQIEAEMFLTGCGVNLDKEVFYFIEEEPEGDINAVSKQRNSRTRKKRVSKGNAG